MKMEVTIYRRGQIHRAYPKVGFKSALEYAAHLLGKEVDILTKQGTAFRLDTTFLSDHEWSATITGGTNRLKDEVFGITVQSRRTRLRQTSSRGTATRGSGI